MNISSAEQLGKLVRQVRLSQKLTQSDLAGACGTGVRFIVDLEKGKVTCALGKALRVVAMLGIQLDAEIPHG
jgi:HTH-type transcriptional regulator/antitoxin HipB